MKRIKPDTLGNFCGNCDFYGHYPPESFKTDLGSCTNRVILDRMGPRPLGKQSEPFFSPPPTFSCNQWKPCTDLPNNAGAQPAEDQHG